jgi:hypothetical protein
MLLPGCSTGALGINRSTVLLLRRTRGRSGGFSAKWLLFRSTPTAAGWTTNSRPSSGHQRLTEHGTPHLRRNPRGWPLNFGTCVFERFSIEC